jgi:hypothetical protein
MHRTEPPLIAWNQVFAFVTTICGILSLLLALVALAGSDRELVVPTLIASSCGLVAMGITRFSCAARSSKGREGRHLRFRMDRGFGLLCIGTGVTALGSLLISPLAASVVGVVMCTLLLWLGARHASERSSRTGRIRKARARAGTLVLAVIIVTLIVEAGLAIALTTTPGGNKAKSDGPTAKKPQEKTPPTEQPPPPQHEGPVEMTYQEMCPSLPDPDLIGHGLGELFEHDGAVKAGCGTAPFSIPGTAIWVAAGMCMGQRQSVAVSSPGHVPAIAYGEASEFIWSAAQSGELTAIEVASPEGGDVVLVETLHGSYGFARSKRSAIAGNPNAERCNEVGGMAEPFAELPPPLLVLWARLIHEEATWFWPVSDEDEEGEVVAFISTEGVGQGECQTIEYCALEFGGKVKIREGGEFTTIADLAEYMPDDEPAA